MSEEIWSPDKCQRKYDLMINVQRNIIRWQITEEIWSGDKCWSLNDPVENVLGSMIHWEMSEEIWSGDKCPTDKFYLARYGVPWFLMFLWLCNWVCVDVVVVALLVVTDHIILSCGKKLWIWCSWRLILSLCSGVIANFCSLPSLLFGQTLGKLQGKGFTNSGEVGCWRTLMVECVTLF